MTASAPSAALGVMSSPTPSTPKPVGPALVVPVDGALSLGPPKAAGEAPGETNGAGTGRSASERRDDAESSAVIQSETGETEGARDDDFGEEDHQIAHDDVDGRLTPVPGRSRSRSISSSSGPSNGDQPSPNSTSISAASQSSQPPRPTTVFNTLPVPPAELGLGTMQGEEQLKSALQSKDRLFLIMVSREIESFVRQVAAGQAPSAAAAIAVGTASTSLLAGHSFRVETSATSKFQRMLVYKAAEWYGLKAVAGTDASIFVGVLGSLSDKSAALRLGELVPQPVDAPQTFRIMQRAQPSSNATPTDGSSSRAASVVGDDVALDGPSRAKTFEEREAAYALARERIYGTANPDGDVTQQVISGGDDEIRGRARRQQEDEVDPVPRHSHGVPSLQASMYEPVYPSLYNPPATDGPPHPPVPSQYGQQPLGYGYGSNGMSYPAYPQMGGMQPVGGFPGAPPMSNGFGANPQSTSHAQMYGGMPQPFVDGSHGGMAYMQQQPNGYGAHGWQQVPSNGLMTPTMMSMQGQMPPQMPPQQVMGGAQGWPPNAGMSQMMPPQPMPMIPQGMPAYPTAYGYSQPPRQVQNNLYPNLVQPTPVRPQPQHHSSASSSISSRSYQDYSRPHSRGSTTSTRSAASSVRLGVMYPAGQNQGAGYRQKGMKTQGLNGVNGMTGLGIGQERRGRAHSPSSTTTTSSRSSRRAGSINLSQPSPGQHPLPQRPDWAANNIPYQPSPMPLQRGAMMSGPNTTDFPPLLRNGTQAEPMQQERAKMRPGTVWNGAAVKALAHGSVGPVGTSAPISPGAPMMSPAPTRTPNPVLQPQAGVPSAIVLPVAPTSSGSVSEYDPDFPRRMPGRSTGTLFDPSAPRPISRPESVNRDKAANGLVGSPATSGVSAVPAGPAVAGSAGTSGASVASGSSGLGGLSGLTATTSGMTPEDVIEAKLAAISVSVGVSIGPPAAKSAPAAPGPAPSYAKIVRRD